MYIVDFLYRKHYELHTTVVERVKRNYEGFVPMSVSTNI